jgi:hypothetical protein
MPTHGREGLQLPVSSANHDDGFADKVEAEVVARFVKLLGTRNQQPFPTKNVLTLR